MDQRQIADAAQLLVRARREGTPIPELPIQPATIAEAHAIQDEVTSHLGEPVGAFKGAAPPNDEPTRGVIYARTIRPSPARVPVSEAPDCGVEAEVAFRFLRDLPPRAAPYTREEVAGAVEACAAIEIVTSRFRDQASRSTLEKLADSVSNGGLVHAAPLREWRRLDLPNIHVTLMVNGAAQIDQNGGHPTRDPLGVAVAIVNLLREGPGVLAGQFATCGSYTGLRFLGLGDTCTAQFEGLGTAEAIFAR